MFGWSKKKKIKVYCPRCLLKFIVIYEKDGVFETYYYEGFESKELATTLCASCKTELLIILRENRMIWDPKYEALDVEFEKEEGKYLRANLQIAPLPPIIGEDDQTWTERVNKHNLEVNEYHKKKLYWEVETKRRLGYNQKWLNKYEKEMEKRLVYRRI